MMRSRLARPVLAAPLLVACAALVPACGSSSSSGGNGTSASTTPAAATVEIKNYQFNPATVTIKPGEAVQWNFDDAGVAHNVIGDDGMHTSDMTSGSYRHTFKHAGTFNYQCSLHASMHGVVLVQ
jgi:plastocyanin